MVQVGHFTCFVELTQIFVYTDMALFIGPNCLGVNNKPDLSLICFYASVRRLSGAAAHTRLRDTHKAEA